MFTNEMANILLAGLCNGLLVSLPIGAASMQAALRWVHGERMNSFAMASGVFLGDIVVAMVVMGLLKHGVVKVTWPFMLTGALLMFFMAWQIRRHQHVIETVDSARLCLLMGLGLTLLQPGNYGTYLLTYGGQWMSVQYLFGVPQVMDMPVSEIALLIAMNGVGLVIGWGCYLVAVLVWGLRWQAQFSWLTSRLVAMAGLIALGHIAYDYLFAPAMAG